MLIALADAWPNSGRPDPGNMPPVGEPEVVLVGGAGFIMKPNSAQSLSILLTGDNSPTWAKRYKGAG